MRTNHRIFLVVIFFTLYLLFKDEILHNGFIERIAWSFSRRTSIILQYSYQIIEKVLLGMCLFHFLLLIKSFFSNKLFPNQQKNDYSLQNVNTDSVNTNKDISEPIFSNFQFKEIFPALRLLGFLMFFPIIFYLIFILSIERVDSQSIQDNYYEKWNQIQFVHSEPIFEGIDKILSMTNTYTNDGRNLSNGLMKFLKRNKVPNFEPMQPEYFNEFAELLYVNREMTLERELLKIWAENLDWDNDEYFNYLDKNYYKNYDYFLSNKQFNRLSWHADNFLKRVGFHDTTYRIDNNNLDERIIHSIIYSDRKLIKASELELKNLNELVSRFFEGELILSDLVGLNYDYKPFNKVRDYLKGLVLFRNDEYRKAYDAFSAVSNNSRNTYLKNYSALLKARCVFWDFDRKNMELNRLATNTINSLELIKKEIKIPNLSSDVAEYIEMIEFNEQNINEKIH